MKNQIKQTIQNDLIAQKEIAITLIFIEIEKLKAKGFSTQLALKLATIKANEKFNSLIN